jgi:hypothetical protein
LLLFYKALHLEAQQVSTRIKVRRHQGREVFEEKIEKPLELYSHANSNVIRMNSLNTVIANATENSKFGEPGFDKHDIFSSPALVEKICFDDILSPICDNSNDACDPHPFALYT